MQCPIDQTQLVMTDRQGVEIDYCPQCRGVWLDRGELDKIIERGSGSGAFHQQSVPAQQQRSHSDWNDDDDDHDHHRSHDDRHYDGHDHHGKKKKRENFLEDMFDF